MKKKTTKAMRGKKTPVEKQKTPKTKSPSPAAAFRALTATLQGVELPGFSDFQAELDRSRNGDPLRNYEWIFWTTHFHRLLSQSVSAVSSCMAPGISHEQLISEAEEIFGKKINDRLTDFIPVIAVRSLRDTVFKILIYMKRAASRLEELASAEEHHKIIRSEILSALDLIEKWHTQPKARITRQLQRKKKRVGAKTRKYGSDFMDRCTALINAALKERNDNICNTGCDSETPFAPSCFSRTMPFGNFGIEYKDYKAWSKWIIEMLAHRTRQQDLCALTFRKRKRDIMDILIPRLWDEVGTHS
jgi:hypothetical protein